MSWFVVIGVLVVGVVGLIIAVRGSDDWQDDWGVLIVGLVLVVAIVALIILGIRAWSISYAGGKCEQWGERTERQVKWEPVSYWTYVCFVNTDDGWIDRDLLYVDEGPGR